MSVCYTAYVVVDLTSCLSSSGWDSSVSVLSDSRRAVSSSDRRKSGEGGEREGRAIFLSHPKSSSGVLANSQ